jgi:hypothetical protein
LFANLTVIQGRLLTLLEDSVLDAEERVSTQDEVQRKWEKFTSAMDQSLGGMQGNVTYMMGEVVSRLLYLQRFTRDSTRFVTDELDLLRDGVGDVRRQVDMFRVDMGDFIAAEKGEIETLGRISQGQFSAVLRTLENFIPMVDHLTFIHSEMVVP